MKIAICSSMAFANKIVEVKNKLEKQGHEVILPKNTEKYLDGEYKKRAQEWGSVEGADLKIKNNLIKEHYIKIQNSDAVLIINEDKKGIKGYIGGNTFLEMGFAFVLNKKIFVLNALPEEIKFYYQELLAMRPVVLNGNLNQIK